VSSAEQRLARTLLLLVHCDKRGKPKKIRPTISQTTLAGIVGTTRPRINFLLRKFKTLAFIDMDGGLIVNRSLLSDVLHD
jgi:CRP/FNR family transcriptional regulator, cyclic AMP receptor protein